MTSFRHAIAAVTRVAVLTLGMWGGITCGLSVLTWDGVSVMARILPLQNVGSPHFTLTRFREAAERGPVEVVFIGASHAYRGFDPRLFAEVGVSSQNLGSSSQTPLNSVTVLQRHLPHLRPKLVVYELYAPVFSLSGMESYYDLLSNTPIDSGTVAMAWQVQHPHAWTALLSTWVRHQLTPLAEQRQQELADAGDRFIPGGYVQRETLFPEARLKALRQGLKVTVEPWRPEQLAAMRRCVALARQHGAEVVACSYPIPQEMRQATPDFWQTQRRMAEWMAAEGVRYRDFNETMHLETARHYYDEIHLNHAGVERFNQALIEWLNKETLLPQPSLPGGREHR